ncbi:MAG: radical SAM protein [Candidatus Omnitrophica bacterium]|nr:radical SAM protein [Candidatus Omnitrophota bacterium]MDD5670730.1 radical SAM protein [Candidatus Omnitrophota bacterium]
MSFKEFGYPKAMPEVLSLLVTNRCCCRCLHCFNWKDVNPKGAIGDESKKDLTLDEIERTFSGIGHLGYIYIGGGEPFMREDIGDILKILSTVCRPVTINLSTNGQFPDKVTSVVSGFLEEGTRTELVVKVSLDGVGEDHDRIRQRVNAYAKAMETYRALGELKKSCPGLTVGLNTVYSALNEKRIPAFYEHVSSLDPRPDCLAQLLVRDIPRGGEAMKAVDLEAYQAWTDRYDRDMWEGRFEHDRKVKIATILMHRYLHRALKTGMPVIHCMAGIAGAFIDNEGNVGACEHQVPYGNLRAAGYDFKKIWFSGVAQEARQKTYQSCHCTNEPQWWHPSIRYNPPVVREGYVLLMWYLLHTWIRKIRRAMIAKKR